MSALLVSKEASIGAGAAVYQRHCPEQGLLYQLIERHYPSLLEKLTVQGHALPNYVRHEFDSVGIPVRRHSHYKPCLPLTR